MREAQEKRARRKPRRSRGPRKSRAADKPAKEYEVDFDVKETGQKKSIAGYDTHETIVTITVREKGKTLDEAGGIVMTNDIWLGPKIAALKEITDFDLKYWKQLQGPEVAAISAEQMASCWRCTRSSPRRRSAWRRKATSSRARRSIRPRRSSRC